jgi:pimeloyl-ACP methyl ester carboxylesterase
MPSDRRFRAGDGAVLRYEDTGSGDPAFVFVHGWQGDRSAWGGVIEELGPGVRAIALDQRGSGASSDAPGPFRLERFAADLQELIDTLGIAPAVIVGHSMGATVALRCAVDAPSSVRALVLIAPVPASGGGYSPKGEAFLRATAGDAEAARTWLARTLVDASNEAALERLCAAAARSPRTAALESFESWAFADFAGETRGINAPVLVIAPERDAPDVSERTVTALLPNARHVVLQDAAHYAIVEQPEPIARLIRGFAA